MWRLARIARTAAKNQTMKKIIIILLIAGGAFYFSKRNPKEAQAPDVISNPVYAETRVKLNLPGSSVEGVMLGKTADDADCKKQIDMLEKQLARQTQNVCPTCTFQPSQCKSELAPRYAKLFDNQPTHVTYISLDRGDPAERETRFIYWGVTVEQSNNLCNVIPEFQKGRKGNVKCIRAAQ
jgi:hypothetical protein